MILDFSKIPIIDTSTGEPLSDDAKENLAHMYRLRAVLNRGLEALDFDLANPEHHREDRLKGRVYFSLQAAFFRTLETVASMIDAHEATKDIFSDLPEAFNPRNVTGRDDDFKPALND